MPLSRRSCSTGSSVDAVCASMAWVMTSSPTRLMIWSTFSTPTRMEVDSLSVRGRRAGGARRLGDGFGSGGRLGHGGRGRSRRDSSRRRRLGLRLRGELLGRLRELLDRGRRRRCARSRLAGDVQLIGVDDEAADRLDIVGRAGAVDPDGQRAIGALAGAHLTQVAHFLEQGLGVLVRHLGDAHAQRRPAPSPAGAAAAGSGQARVRARAAARGRDGSGAGACAAAAGSLCSRASCLSTAQMRSNTASSGSSEAR